MQSFILRRQSKEFYENIMFDKTQVRTLRINDCRVNVICEGSISKTVADIVNVTGPERDGNNMHRAGQEKPGIGFLEPKCYQPFTYL